MNDEELRSLVRRIVTERLSLETTGVSHAPPLDPRGHASHGRLRMAPSVERGQPCVIEPHVGCSLCGYCQSMGH